MTITQRFNQAGADAAFPQGCKCGNNGGGDCDWCGVYYGEQGSTPVAEKIDNLIAAQEIIMQARCATVRLAPVHAKLCRIGDYINSQAGQLLKEAEAGR